MRECLEILEQRNISNLFEWIIIFFEELTVMIIANCYFTFWTRLQPILSQALPCYRHSINSKSSACSPLCRDSNCLKIHPLIRCHKILNLTKYFVKFVLSLSWLKVKLFWVRAFDFMIFWRVSKLFSDS